MTEQERVRRPKLARTGPIRDFTTLIRDEGPGNDGDSKLHSADDTVESGLGDYDAVARSVKLGYTVIQEQIRQGRRIAQQMGRLSANGGGRDGDMSRILRRMLYFSADFGALLSDLTEMTLLAPNGAGAGSDSSQIGKANSARAAGTAGLHLSVEIEGHGRSKVTLDLGANAAAESLAVPALYSLDGESAPLTQIRFESNVLRITIPDDQPSATYTGVVVEKDTNEAKGTLSVKLQR